MYEAASEKLENELDMTKIVKSLRVIEFISRVFLKKHHRALISHFKKHQIAAVSDVV